MKKKKINSFVVLMGFGFIYLGLSMYLSIFSENDQKHYSLLNFVMADIQFTDSQNSQLWYNDENSTLGFSVTAAGSATVVAGSPVKVAPPPSRCTH